MAKAKTSPKSKARKAAPKRKKSAARKAAPRKKAALKKKAAPRKKAATKMKAPAPPPPSRYCLGKCSCGLPCTYNQGHGGACSCAIHAPNP